MSQPSCRRMPGPLGQFADGFLTELSASGYSPRTSEAQLGLMRHLSRWLDTQVLTAGDLTALVVGQFVAERRGRYVQLRSQRALIPLLGYLRTLGVAPAAEPLSPATPAEMLLDRFGQYLSGERGLAAATVSSYLSQVRPFVTLHDGDPGHWSRLTGAQVSAYVTDRAAGQRPRSVQVGGNALRCLLRWMTQEKMVPPLAHAVGRIAAPAGTAVPKGLSPEQLTGLFAQLPAEGPERLRNEAMLTLMCRLGLRAGEVAALRLEGIDWRGGVLVVHGKGGRRDQMPLPADVGKLMAAYLKRGRPSGTPHRQVFLALDAPHGPIKGSAVVSVAARGLARAGIAGPGAAHRLRHTAACQVLARGGGLVEAGELLRHASAQVTAVYAKSDLQSLALLARSWPQAVTR